MTSDKFSPLGQPGMRCALPLTCGKPIKSMISMPGHLFAELEGPYNEYIETPSGFRLHFTPEYDPTQHTTITGRVIAVPANKSIGIAIGDEIIFNYLVVSDMDEHYPYPVHANMLELDGKKVWKVELQFLLGHFRGDDIIPAPGLVFMEALPDVVTEKSPGGLLWIPESAQRKKAKGAAIVRHVGDPKPGDEPMDIEPGDKVLFDERFVQRYKVKGKDWLILGHDRVFAKQIKEVA